MYFNTIDIITIHLLKLNILLVSLLWFYSISIKYYFYISFYYLL